MSITEKEKARAIFRAKVNKFCKENNLTLTEFFKESGIFQTMYRRIYKGQDAYFSTIVRLIKYSKGYFTFEEMAFLQEDKEEQNG